MTGLPAGRRFRPPRSAAIVLVLLASLAVTGVLAYEAHQATRQHRETAEGVLRDYVGLARWEFARLAARDFDTALAGTLAALTCGAPAQSGGMRAALARPPVDPGCPRLGRLESYFRLDLETGALVAQGEPIAPAAAAWIERVSARPAAGGPGIEHGLRLVGTGPGRRAVAYRVTHGRDGRPLDVAGVVGRASMLQPVIQRVLEREPLLPPSLTGGEVDNSLVVLQVAEATGQPVFASDDALVSMAFAAEGALPERLGALQYRIGLRPESAEALVIGGLPRSRLPIIAVVLVLTAGLVGVALVQLRRELELARLRADFVANVSHELRTPLAEIRMFAETLLLGRTRSRADRIRSLQIIDRESRRLSGLVDNVLHLSRAGRQGAAVVPERLPLGPLVTDVIDAFAPLAAARRVRLVADVPATLEARLDPSAFRQVLLNLLDNAVKYGPAGQTVRIGADLEGGSARVWVDDQGPGIPADEQPRVWDPFWRGRLAAGAGNLTGTGIGLAVVRDLVGRHGGDVRIEDAPGGGARVIAGFPGGRLVSGGTAPAAAPAGASMEVA